MLYFNSDFSELFDVLNGIQYDVIEGSEHYIIRFMLPGFDRDKINVELKNKTLSIVAERKVSEDEKFIKKGSYYGKFSKDFIIPDDADDDVDANFNNGVLEIKLKKNSKNKIIQIK